MRKIGIRQFKEEFYKQLKQLPLVITKHLTPTYVVYNYKDSQTPVKSETDNVDHNPDIPTGSQINVDHSVDHKCGVTDCKKRDSKG